MRLGKWLKRNKDGVFGSLVIKVMGPDPHDGTARYKVENTAPVTATSPVSATPAVVAGSCNGSSGAQEVHLEAFVTQPLKAMPDFSSGA